MPPIADLRCRRLVRALPFGSSPVALGLLLAAAMQTSAPAAAAAVLPTVLAPEEMDAVTAGKIRIDLDLAAAAKGPTAMTSTEGSITTGNTTAVRVAMDAAAPEQARARYLGQSNVEVGVAVGKAQATGAVDAKCSAVPTITGADYAITSVTQNLTSLTATCNCTAVAIGILSR